MVKNSISNIWLLKLYTNKMRLMFKNIRNPPLSMTLVEVWSTLQVGKWYHIFLAAYIGILDLNVDAQLMATQV